MRGVLGNFLDSLMVFFKTRHQTDLNQAEALPRQVLRLFRTRNLGNLNTRGKERRTT
jgi:hypothetical protein